MPRIMVGSLFLILASASSLSATPQLAGNAPAFQPTPGARATATVSIRVISGARFGSDHVADETAATRRKSQLTDSAGQPREAELLEFQ